MFGFDALAAVIGRARALVHIALTAPLLAAGVLVAPQAAQAQSFSYSPDGNFASVVKDQGSYIRNDGGVVRESPDGTVDGVAYIRFTIPGGSQYASATLTFYYNDYGEAASLGLTLLPGQPEVSQAGTASVKAAAPLGSGATTGTCVDICFIDVQLNALAISEMNTLSQSGGGVLWIGMYGQSNTAGVDLGTATLSGTINLPPSITSNPVNRTVVAGSTVAFNAAASGSPAPTAQWQVNDGSGFVAIAGATSSSYSFTSSLSQNGFQYRAVFTNAAGSATSNFATLTVGNVPTLASVSPNAGPIGGGTVITITGTNFVAAATTISFGGTTYPANAVTVDSPTSLRFTTPARAAGSVAIRVTTPIASSNTLATGFVYVAAPTATAVSPTSGPASGGTTATITGSNFRSGTTVTIGGTVVTPTAIAQTTLQFTTPPYAAGLVAVTVTTAGGTSGAVPGGFTYIDAVTPGLAVTAGGVSGASVGGSYSQANPASGGTGPYTYALASGALPAGTSLATSTGTVFGTPTTLGAFTYTIQATDFLAVVATGTTVSGTVVEGSQTITFGFIADTPLSASPLTLLATASSGLTVGFASDTTGVCTVSGTTVTFLSVGICTINANQPGDANYTAAPQASRSFMVTAVAPAQIPTLSEWAMILFGLMLAGGAAVVIQRRQTAV